MSPNQRGWWRRWRWCSGGGFGGTGPGTIAPRKFFRGTQPGIVQRPMNSGQGGGGFGGGAGGGGGVLAALRIRGLGGSGGMNNTMNTRAAVVRAVLCAFISYDRVQEQLKLSDDNASDRRLTRQSRRLKRTCSRYADSSLNKEERMVRATEAKEESTRRPSPRRDEEILQNWTGPAKAAQGNLPQRRARMPVKPDVIQPGLAATSN